MPIFTANLFGTKFEQYEKLFFSPEIDLNFEDLETDSNASTSLKNFQKSSIKSPIRKKLYLTVIELFAKFEIFKLG